MNLLCGNVNTKSDINVNYKLQFDLRKIIAQLRINDYICIVKIANYNFHL